MFNLTNEQCPRAFFFVILQYSYVIMSAMASQITGVSIVCWIICSGADERKYQSSASLAFVMGIHLVFNIPTIFVRNRWLNSINGLIWFISDISIGFIGWDNCIRMVAPSCLCSNHESDSNCNHNNGNMTWQVHIIPGMYSIKEWPFIIHSGRHWYLKYGVYFSSILHSCVKYKEHEWILHD